MQGFQQAAQQPTLPFGGSMENTGTGGNQPFTSSFYNKPQASTITSNTLFPSSGNTLPTIAVRPVPFPKETKFVDLPPEMRNSLEAIEKNLRELSEQNAALASRNSYDEGITKKLFIEVREVEKRVASAEMTGETCKGHVMVAKRALNQYWRYGESVARMLVASKQSGEEGMTKWVPVIPPGDNNTLLEEIILRMELQLSELTDSANSVTKQIDYVNERDMIGVGAGIGGVEALRITLRHQMDVFIALASMVASENEEMEKMRESYRSFVKKYRRDHRDPFVPRSSANANVVSIGNVNIVPSVLSSDVGTTISKPSMPLFINNPVPSNTTSNVPSFNFGGGGTNLKRNESVGPSSYSTSSLLGAPSNNPFVLNTPR